MKKKTIKQTFAKKKRRTPEEREKMKVYYRENYKKHREEILEKAREYYYNNLKKTGKCKMCGTKLPKELPGNTKYCDKCLYSKGHGADAHRMAAVRWFRKNNLTKKKGISTI